MILLTLFLEFFKVGLFCFGGAFGMIPLIGETVFTHGWLTESQFYDFIGVCESTPGPIAVNMATYVGASQAGLPGSLAATLGVVTPSFLIILLVASVLKRFTGNPLFKAFLSGVKPVIAALIMSTGLLLAARVCGLTGNEALNVDWNSLGIFAALAGIWYLYRRITGKKLSSPALILIAAALGILFAPPL